MPVQCTCRRCGAAFAIRPSFITKGGGRYCSNVCKSAAQLKGEDRRCRGCGAVFYVSAANIRRGQDAYCSQPCYWKQRDYREWRTRRAPDPKLGEDRTCCICSAPFYAKRYTIRDGRGLYCSDACRGVSQRSLNRDRSGWEYKTWRRAVFERDDFTCQRCGIRGGNLHAHHIKGWRRYPALRFEVSNGMTLHERCHYEWHQEHGRY